MGDSLRHRAAVAALARHSATQSHQRFLDTLASALPASVSVTIDRARGVMACRIAGEVRACVQAEIDRIAATLANSETADWSATFTKPIRWGDEFVAHGEVFAGTKAMALLPPPPLRLDDVEQNYFAIAAE